MPKKSCGGCREFIKWKNDRYGGGLCELKDARTKSDNPACDKFKRDHICGCWNRRAESKEVIDD